MKTYIILVAALIWPSLGFSKKLKVDPNHSAITFEATHLKISTIPGRFTEFSGTIDLDEKDITKSKVDLEVHVASITTAVAKRDDHLRTSDFSTLKGIRKLHLKMLLSKRAVQTTV